MGDMGDLFRAFKKEVNEEISDLEGLLKNAIEEATTEVQKARKKERRARISAMILAQMCSSYKIAFEMADLESWAIKRADKLLELLEEGE